MSKDPAQKKFDGLMRRIKSGEFKYQPREGEKIDWSKYDKAQINEMNEMLLLMREAVDWASARLGVDDLLKDRRAGRPETHPADLAKAVLLQQYFGVSNRVTEGFVKLFMEKMEIEQGFSYKTIERAYNNPLVIMILKEVFKMTQEPVSDKEHRFSPDGTGLSTSMKQNWENDCKKGEKKGYEKMIAMVGATYKIFSAVAFAENPMDNESPYLEPLLAETVSCYERIDLVSGDAAYLSRHNCDLIAEAGAIPRIYPKQGITLRMKGSAAWAEMLLDFIDDPQEWLRSYHPRSISESANSAFKRGSPIPLRKRKTLRKKLEAFARICDYNLKRLCYLKYLENISAVDTWAA